MQNSEIIIHTDGGSRGNPGPAACAFVANKDGSEIFNTSKYLGLQTNNFAEYSGVILALEWLSTSSHILSQLTRVVFYLDSELVAKQLSGLYKVRDENLKKLFYKALDLIKQSSVKASFKNIPRAENVRADLLVNEELDSHFTSLN